MITKGNGESRRIGRYPLECSRGLNTPAGGKTILFLAIKKHTFFFFFCLVTWYFMSGAGASRYDITRISLASPASLTLHSPIEKKKKKLLSHHAWSTSAIDHRHNHHPEPRHWPVAVIIIIISLLVFINNRADTWNHPQLPREVTAPYPLLLHREAIRSHHPRWMSMRKRGGIPVLRMCDPGNESKIDR